MFVMLIEIMKNLVVRVADKIQKENTGTKRLNITAEMQHAPQKITDSRVDIGANKVADFSK